ncbi:MAG: cation:proton antiporter [Ignavibacteria bacterium]|nr:cation:proton antiporter [Ignavibacteria bacterium]
MVGCAGNIFAPSHLALTLLWIVVLLILSRLSALVERFGQPGVLGELIAGVILGNLTLFGITALEPLRQDEIITFLSELGVVILLFQVGLESDYRAMRKVGMRAFAVALVGVLFPFFLGTYIAGPLLMPGLPFTTYLFLGAILTATSIGISARVFKDAKALQTPEAQIVLGAAVIDDIMGLILLAVVTAIVKTGNVSLLDISIILGKAIGFLGGGLLIGQFSAGLIGNLLSKLSGGTAMKLTFALVTCLLFSFVADSIGLAPIIGAFTAGIVLDAVHFKHFDNPAIVGEIESALSASSPATQARVQTILDVHAIHHLDDIIAPIGHFLSPIFFVMTGFAVQVHILANFHIILVVLGLTAVAILGKLASGLVAGKVRKLIVGVGMIPRGEVGLIFASIGMSLGVISGENFSVIVIVVILTTLITPLILAPLLRRRA